MIVVVLILIEFEDLEMTVTSVTCSGTIKKLLEQKLDDGGALIVLTI